MSNNVYSAAISVLNRRGEQIGDDELMHYGRKGMKRGEHIFGEEYEPIGEKARDSAEDDNKNDLEKKKNDFLLKAKAERMLRNSEHKNEHSISDATREAVTGKITDREYADKLKNDPEFAEATKAIREGKASNAHLVRDVEWREGDHTYGADVDANKDALSYINGSDETRDKMDKETQEKNRKINKKIEMLDKVRAEKQARTKGANGFGDATEKAFRGAYDANDINRMVKTGPEYDEASKAIREGKTNSVNLAKIDIGDGEEHIGRITNDELKDKAQDSDSHNAANLASKKQALLARANKEKALRGIRR